MKEAAGEANMTVITIVLIAIVLGSCTEATCRKQTADNATDGTKKGDWTCTN